MKWITVNLYLVRFLQNESLYKRIILPGIFNILNKFFTFSE